MVHATAVQEEYARGETRDRPGCPQSLWAANAGRVVSGPVARPRRSAHATDGYKMLPGSPIIDRSQTLDLWARPPIGTGFSVGTIGGTSAESRRVRRF